MYTSLGIRCILTIVVSKDASGINSGGYYSTMTISSWS